MHATIFLANGRITPSILAVYFFMQEQKDDDFLSCEEAVDMAHNGHGLPHPPTKRRSILLARFFCTLISKIHKRTECVCSKNCRIMYFLCIVRKVSLGSASFTLFFQRL